MIIELNLRLRNHETEPVPFDTLFIGITPTITPVNAAMLFGQKPRVYRLFLNQGFGPAENDSYVVLTTQLTGDYEQDLYHCKMSLSEFRSLELLWCLRDEYESAVAQILKALHIKHDHEVAPLFPEVIDDEEVDE